MSDSKEVEVYESHEMILRPANAAHSLLNSAGGIVTTLDRTKPEEQALMSRAMGAPDFKLEDILNETLILKHILAHDVDLVDKVTGEVKSATRIVLITEEEKTISTCSAGIYRSVQYLISITSEPPWIPGIRVKIKAVPTSRGFRTYSLEFIGISQREVPKAKGGK